jgi:hypothetical protein
MLACNRKVYIVGENNYTFSVETIHICSYSGLHNAIKPPGKYHNNIG